MLKTILNSLAMHVMVIKGNASLRRLEKNSKHPAKTNEALLKKILRRNKNTLYGKEHGFADIRSVEDFRSKVPVSGYEDFAPYIERVIKGESKLLTADKILGYSRTSGSSGVPKYIPATSASLKAYVNYTWTRALALGAAKLREEGKKYRPGRGVFLSPATNETLPDGTLCSNIAEIGARRYGVFYPFILTIPGREIFDVHDGDYIYCIYRFALSDERATFVFSVFFSVNVSQLAYLKDNWEVLVSDIEKGVISPEVKISDALRKRLEPKLRPMPERAAYLRRQFEQGFDGTILKRLWPDMTVLCGIGNASFKPAADALRRSSDGIPFDFSIYGASEALVAACFRLESTDMQLLVDSCYMEFVPYGETPERYLGVEELELGGQYELLITTQAGLYRYRLKDVIEVKGFRNNCPLISFVFRKGQLFNFAGEKFSEEDAQKSMGMFSERHGVTVDKWLFYSDDSVVPSRYALAVEGEAFETIEQNIDELEGIMGECNKRYTSQREKSFISRMIVVRQKDGTHEAWAKSRVKSGASVSQLKPVHWLDNDEKKEFFLSRLAD
ncbi:MAG: GH3 auxin-responsive promoter family protein [Clostridia bacterium]|nr:GH3 auxin-responsive promoter family protein [Clostridia bacterium]